MKFMGSKRWMLQNGLGQLLQEKAASATRFIDLFTGSGTVASFVAEKVPIPVKAFDLQLFCVTLAEAVITRVEPLEAEVLWAAWQRRATEHLDKEGRLDLANQTLPKLHEFTKKYVLNVRRNCSEETGYLLTCAYGGHYFSQSQTLWLDALRCSLPRRSLERTVALAALIQGASKCAASPGHTAQPLQPTASAKEYIYEAWQQDLKAKVQSALQELCARSARCKGAAEVQDANNAVKEIKEHDLVFIDPPYSSVHYSRFYHVLETIARGKCSDVSGIGRYPPPAERPRSRYSVRTESCKAISELLETIAEKKATAIVTFPNKQCSNAISSDLLRQLGERHFHKVSEKVIQGIFSTLGGNGNHRKSRQPSNELILILEP